MDGWKTALLLGRPIFRGYVSFREGIEQNELVPPWKCLGRIFRIFLEGYHPLRINVFPKKGLFQLGKYIFQPLILRGFLGGKFDPIAIKVPFLGLQSIERGGRGGSSGAS